jgi:endonuclease G
MRVTSPLKRILLPIAAFVLGPLVLGAIITGQDQLARQPVLAATTNKVDGESTSADETALHTRVRPSLLRRGMLQSEFSATEKSWIADNCKWGMPKQEQGAALGPVKLVVREGYVLGHSSLSREPYWVCEHSTRDKLVGPGDRKLSKFLPDPKLAGFPRAELRDYAKSGFDRGHMAPAGDAKKTQKMMDETHFLSNMVPQVGLTYNRGIWARLEDTVRKWTEKRGETWIVTGPMFYDPLEEHEETADGLVPYQTIGDDEVAVPTHCYKIILAKNDSGEWESIAFVLANTHYAQPFRLELYLTTIHWIEERTGLDFFPDLTGDPQTLALKNRLESKRSPMWETE